MCGVCGCGVFEEHDHHHHHDDHHHHHDHEIVGLERRLLDKNDRLAARNRRWLAERSIAAINLIGSPGAGKTALLESAYQRMNGSPELTVLEGDQATDNDAARLRRLGCRVAQINTGTVCHLDAEMIMARLEELEPPRGSLLAIENVGNLVCPSLFDLGERAKVVVMSVTEGEDKPLKYPHVFRASSILVLTKTDLLPHLDFDVEACSSNARRINPDLRTFMLSARTGEGVGDLCAYLAAEVSP